MSTLQSCMSNRWSPGIGDPSVLGWGTVLGYVLVSLAALHVAKTQPLKVCRRFWLVLALVLAALALNKQLDLQSALTAIGRCHAKANGWYENRRQVQIVFIAVLLLVSFAGTFALAHKFRGHLVALWPAILGIAFLSGFIAVRAVGFHHFDAFIGLRVAQLKMNWILELGGLITIALGAVFANRGSAVQNLKSGS